MREIAAPTAERRVRVLELRCVRGTGGGPEKTILQGAAHAGSGIDVTVCYLRHVHDPAFNVDARATTAGVTYTEVRERHSLDPAIWGSLRRLVRERGIDVIHAHDYKTNLAALLLSRASGTVALSTAHGWTGHTRRERLLYYPGDKRVLRRFPLVVAVSTQVKGELVASGCRPERIRVLLNGIDEEVYRRDPALEQAARDRLEVPAGRFVIGAVGRLEPQKRFDLLIEGFRRLRSAHPHVHLLIAGEGSSKPELQAQIDESGLASCCRLLGHMSEIRFLHHAFDLFVQSSSYEGTPNAVLEAMALETPLVATAAGGTTELVHHGRQGLIVPPDDVHALVSAMALAITDSGGRLERSAAARRRVEAELSFERRLRTLESIYRELAETSRAS